MVLGSNTSVVDRFKSRITVRHQPIELVIERGASYIRGASCRARVAKGRVVGQRDGIKPLEGCGTCYQPPLVYAAGKSMAGNVQ